MGVKFGELKINATCSDAIPSHSYMRFDGSTGRATVTETGVIYHHPSGYSLPTTFGDLYEFWSIKGTNAIAAKVAMAKLGKVLNAKECVCGVGFVIPEGHRKAGKCWWCGNSPSA